MCFVSFIRKFLEGEIFVFTSHETLRLALDNITKVLELFPLKKNSTVQEGD